MCVHEYVFTYVCRSFLNLCIHALQCTPVSLSRMMSCDFSSTAGVCELTAPVAYSGTLCVCLAVLHLPQLCGPSTLASL
jgi:hypothetical protein